MSLRIFLPILCVSVYNLCQTANGVVQPLENHDCICLESEEECSCTLEIEHRLTMILTENGETRLVKADRGTLRFAESKYGNEELTETQKAKVLTADAEGSRLLIAINGMFPGPRIEAYADQTLEIKLINKLHTDSVTVHFHGLHQRDTPWMDGVAFVTQCPILPGQTFVYSFAAYPAGTSMYHAHIGDQRSMGLYGPVIIHPKKAAIGEQIVISLQDWNHLMDPETAYRRMITEQFDFNTNNAIPTTYSSDGAMFSRFEFHSGLVNGKGRFWSSSNMNNGGPLERFYINRSQQYRFRIIGAMTLYPMRVFIQGYNLTLIASDGFPFSNITVQSIIVHPGERYDFIWTSPTYYNKKEILFTAKTIETEESLGSSKYHAAEAILEFKDVEGNVNPNPNKAEESCTTSSPCMVVNCPFTLYPISENRKCVTYNDLRTSIKVDPKLLWNKVDNEYFFNFAFPGPAGQTDGSVNGRQFRPPPVAMLTQPEEVNTKCDQTVCLRVGICNCTFSKKIPSNKVIQMVWSNIGTGSGWSHPIHLHGHSFHVMKMGFPEYNPSTGKIQMPTSELQCTDERNYCTSLGWVDATWAGGNVPDLNHAPPLKDTIIVPSG